MDGRSSPDSSTVASATTPNSTSLTSSTRSRQSAIPIITLTTAPSSTIQTMPYNDLFDVPEKLPRLSKRNQDIAIWLSCCEKALTCIQTSNSVVAFLKRSMDEANTPLARSRRRRLPATCDPARHFQAQIRASRYQACLSMAQDLWPAWQTDRSWGKGHIGPLFDWEDFARKYGFYTAMNPAMPAVGVPPRDAVASEMCARCYVHHTLDETIEEDWEAFDFETMFKESIIYVKRGGKDYDPKVFNRPRELRSGRMVSMF
ncbi:MAG: hypothetical protein M1820_000752 [Bogoriella megaspora]|nr:MAG: hypothetical protein M1820_000752 [Bogoriella megaspora]